MGRSESGVDTDVYIQKLEYRLATLHLQHRYDMKWYEFTAAEREQLIKEEMDRVWEVYGRG